MKSARRYLPALVVSLGLMLAPTASQGEAQLTTSAPSASGALDFRIIIPPMMRVLENSHPPQLTSDADGALGGLQHLVVLSNMKRGFCVTLRLTQAGLDHWQVDVAPEPGLSVQPAGDGWRLCSARPGRYALNLQHRFIPSGVSAATTPVWPVQTDITAI